MKLKLDNNDEPIIEGNFEFKLGESIYDGNLSSKKNIYFNFSFESLQDLITFSGNHNKLYNIIGKKLKDDFILYIKNRTINTNNEDSIVENTNEFNLKLLSILTNEKKLEFIKKFENELTNEELCDIIVYNIGIPIPTYSYSYRKYISTVPTNINLNGGVTGIEIDDSHDTFREACLRIIYWWVLN